MRECKVCGGDGMPGMGGVALCWRHQVMFKRWITHWRARTGYKGRLKMTPEKIVNMLRNIDKMRGRKREQVQDKEQGNGRAR